MIERLVGHRVAAVDTFDDAAEPPLFAEERAVVANAVDKRRREFAGVRACAREALARLGVPPVPILPGLSRSPTWPDGIVGSMTHCDGYRAAAVAYSHEVGSVGIDAEPHRPLPADVVEMVRTPAERRQHHILNQYEAGVHWETVLFSIKESVFKAWFPLTHRWLGHEQAVVSIDPVRGTFAAELAVPIPVPDAGRITRVAGRWLVRSRLVMTAVVIAHPAVPLVHARSATASDDGMEVRIH